MNDVKYLFLSLLVSFGLIINTLGATVNSQNEKLTVSGHVRDAANGEELIGVNIIIKELMTGTVTNVYGFYSISLTPGKYTLTYSYIGFQAQERQIELNKNKQIDIELDEETKNIQEVVVTAKKKNQNVTRPEMSVQKLQAQTIKQVPVLLGETDVIKVIQLLPGVQSGSEGSSGFSVRGGGLDQNLVLLDEATVYNASHFLGFFSVFNNDAIKNVTLYKGDIPASNGGRLSSLLDIRMKDGNSKKFSGSGGIGILSSRLTLEAPIIKDKTSFVLSGRRTYFDLFLPLAKDPDAKKSKIFFHDINVKLNHRINDKNRIFASSYFGRDQFGNNDFYFGFGNKTFTLRWNHLFSQRLFSNFTIISSKYDYALGSKGNDANAFKWSSSMRDIGAKVDFTWFANTNNTIKYGIQSIHHTFKPGKISGKEDNSVFSEYKLHDNYALESAAYLSNEQKIGSKLTLKYGLRFSMFQNIGDATIYSFDENYNVSDTTKYSKGDFFNTYSGLEPRVGITYLLNDNSSVKASYNRTKQYIQLASNSTMGTPLDIWFPASPNIKPQLADQYAIGYFKNFLGDKIEGSIETYYKKSKNTIDFKDHAILLLNTKLDGEIRTGRSEAYGTEFMLKYNGQKLNGWLAYTLSKTERKISGVNENRSYPAPYDKTHDITMVISYKASKRVTLSANWVFSSGMRITYPTGRFMMDGSVFPTYSDRYSKRAPNYHRLDLGITIQSKKNNTRRWQGEWNFSLYNAYGRKNVWAIDFVQDEDDPKKTHAEKIYLFTFVPSVTYNFKF